MYLENVTLLKNYQCFQKYYNFISSYTLKLIHGLKLYIDGLVQDCSISIANAMEILQSCTKPSASFICSYANQCISRQEEESTDKCERSFEHDPGEGSIPVSGAAGGCGQSPSCFPGRTLWAGDAATTGSQ